MSDPKTMRETLLNREKLLYATAFFMIAAGVIFLIAPSIPEMFFNFLGLNSSNGVDRGITSLTSWLLILFGVMDLFVIKAVIKKMEKNQ